MRSEDFRLLYELEDTFWWFVAMRRITDRILAPVLDGRGPLRICDAGCGTGINLDYYAAKGHDVFGIDLASDAIDWVRQRGNRRVARASVTELPFATGSFDIVTSFDVIGQVPGSGDAAGIGEMQRVLKPGGRLFIRSAAYEWLRSSHDTELHTFHRYNRPQMRQLLTDAGLRVEWISYLNCFLFPVVVARRMLKHAGIGGGSDVRPLPGALSWIDPVLRSVLASEAAFLRPATLPFGLSVAAVAQKPERP